MDPVIAILILLLAAATYAFSNSRFAKAPLEYKARTIKIERSKTNQFVKIWYRVSAEFFEGDFFIQDHYLAPHEIGKDTRIMPSEKYESLCREKQIDKLIEQGFISSQGVNYKYNGQIFDAGGNALRAGTKEERSIRKAIKKERQDRFVWLRENYDLENLIADLEKSYSERENY